MSARQELRYLLVVDLLEQMAAEGLLSKKELSAAKRLAQQKIKEEAVCQL